MEGFFLKWKFKGVNEDLGWEIKYIVLLCENCIFGFVCLGFWRKCIGNVLR